MPVLTRCEHCQKLSRVADVFANRQVRCPFCKQVFLARTAEEELPTAVRPTNGVHTPQAAPVTLPRPAVAHEPLKTVVQLTCRAGKAALRGASLCISCGWMAKPLGSNPLVETEEQPLLCTNPACGTANSRSARYCARCQAMLPSPPGAV